jgi:anthranilate phosphoribosyltransferase
MAVFKGEGGEIEFRPTKPVEVQALHDGVTSDEAWPALLPDTTAEKDETLDLKRLGAVWRAEAEDVYGEAALIGTTAIALKLLGRAADPAQAMALARRLWNERNRKALPAAA